MDWLTSLTTRAALELADIEPDAHDTGLKLTAWDRGPMAEAAKDAGKDPLEPLSAKLAIRYQPMNTAVMEIQGEELVHRVRLDPGTFDIVRDLEGIGCRVELLVGGRRVSRTMVLPTMALSTAVEVAMAVDRTNPPAEFGIDATVKTVAQATRDQVRGRTLTVYGYTFKDGALMA
jgi:hypothetical protein